MTSGEQFRRFWRWWTGELRACVPSGFVRAVNRLRVLPLVLAESDGFTLYPYDGSTWERVAHASHLPFVSRYQAARGALV